MRGTIPFRTLVMVFVASLLVAGCQTTQSKLLDSDQSQVELRSYQSRVFDTTNKEKTLRTIIATLQDLNFVVDKADLILGTVTGTKLNQWSLRMTVSVRPRGENQLLIRANAQFNVTAVTDPEPYQQFFASLEKAMFLRAHQVD